MDVMALVSELPTNIIILVTRPFSLFKLLCLFGIKTTFIIVHTCIELMKASVCFHVILFWRITMWTFALISLPGRVLTALERERQLERHLLDMQIELENLAWDRKELQEHLQTAIKEQKMMELILAELEEEHDKAIAKIELLASELHDLKTENLRLREIQGKGYWKNKGRDETGNVKDLAIADYGIPYGIPSWKSHYDGSGMILQDLLMHKDTWGDESKTKTELLRILRNESISSGPIHPVMPEINLGNLDMSEVLDQRRGIAIKQSLFSAVLSLLVGIIVWQAEDPCMPLVVALFTVVGMSLKSVVQFFSTINNRPASDAVALLSFNWFILGTLTYPTLPKVAHMVAPVALNFVDRALSLLGFSFFLA
ncbi:PREDICTED: uncharacterized protein LOC103336688 [Prunus mume]|uniref:Uncharacterized protein LOC103336688 n=1 Tax=Prunus mume TaxID=102107 RepID=A0ABM1LVL1_PRUMU|nr:PREDICTED: uncharacterized protein LOC103336688 [Prunus mume]XP_016651438.1 PREDICTED: uncharacterized protein LOC103336688 [Prunus mume]XP_016651439.1 PREDICTED: uncharacterized protein LOC103336688 [Prunus mume]